MAAFKGLAADNRPERKHNSNDCCDIQFVLCPVHFGLSRLFGLSGLSCLFGLFGLFGGTR
jgi:hypothetical protein